MTRYHEQERKRAERIAKRQIREIQRELDILVKAGHVAASSNLETRQVEYAYITGRLA